jgi:predicted signal transduction protein with EAL and GGDEF domain
MLPRLSDTADFTEREVVPRGSLHHADRQSLRDSSANLRNRTVFYAEIDAELLPARTSVQALPIKL